MESLSQGYRNLDVTQKAFFMATTESDDISVNPLSKLLKLDSTSFNLASTYFCFADSSNSSNPGWPLRLFIAALVDHCPQLAGKCIQVISIRSNVTGGLEKSVIYTVEVPEVCNVEFPSFYIFMAGLRKDRQRIECQTPQSLCITAVS